MKNKLGLYTIEFLLVALIVLFLLKVFDVGIPWLWVLSPVWIPAVCVMIWIIAWILIATIKDFIEQRKRRKWH